MSIIQNKYEDVREPFHNAPLLCIVHQSPRDASGCSMSEERHAASLLIAHERPREVANTAPPPAPTRASSATITVRRRVRHEQ